MHNQSIKRTSYILVAFMCVFLMMGVSKCSKDESLTKQQQIIEGAWKTLKSVDIATDTTLKVLGSLYKDGKITDKQKDEIIKVGNEVRNGMEILKESLAAYAKAIENHQDEDEAYDQVIEDLKIALKAFKNLKDNAEELYKSVTGSDLPIPDIEMLDVISGLL